MTALKRQAKALSSWLSKHKAATDELRARVATTASRLAAHYEAVLQRWRAIAASGSTIAALRELYAQTPLPSELDFAQLHVDERAALARLGRPLLDEALLLRVAGALLTSIDATMARSDVVASSVDRQCGKRVRAANDDFAAKRRQLRSVTRALEDAHDDGANDEIVQRVEAEVRATKRAMRDAAVTADRELFAFAVSSVQYPELKVRISFSVVCEKCIFERSLDVDTAIGTRHRCQSSAGVGRRRTSARLGELRQRRAARRWRQSSNDEGFEFCLSGWC